MGGEDRKQPVMGLVADQLARVQNPDRREPLAGP
jgi:hypothetical protein